MTAAILACHLTSQFGLTGYCPHPVEVKKGQIVDFAFMNRHWGIPDEKFTAKGTVQYKLFPIIGVLVGVKHIGITYGETIKHYPTMYCGQVPFRSGFYIHLSDDGLSLKGFPDAALAMAACQFAIDYIYRSTRDMINSKDAVPEDPKLEVKEYSSLDELIGAFKDKW